MLVEIVKLITVNQHNFANYILCVMYYYSNLEHFVAMQHRLLVADVVVVADGEVLAADAKQLMVMMTMV